MANTAQTKKRARQNVKQGVHNHSLRARLRTAIKLVIKAIQIGRQAYCTGCIQNILRYSRLNC